MEFIIDGFLAGWTLLQTSFDSALEQTHTLSQQLQQHTHTRARIFVGRQENVFISFMAHTQILSCTNYIFLLGIRRCNAFFLFKKKRECFHLVLRRGNAEHPLRASSALAVLMVKPER